MPPTKIEPIQVPKDARMISIANLVVSEYNTRLEPNPGGVEQLAESIGTIGLQNPLLVRQVVAMPDTFEVISGSRRLAALKLIGEQKAKCFVASNMEDDQALISSLHENMKRGDITAQELSRAIKRLMGMLDPSLSDMQKRREVARILGWENANGKPDTNRVKEAITLGEFQQMLPDTVIKYRQRGDSRKPTMAWSTAKQVHDALTRSNLWSMMENMPPEQRSVAVKEFADTYSNVPASKRKDFLRLFEGNPMRPPKELAEQLREEELKTQTLAFRVDRSLWQKIDTYAMSIGAKRGEAVKRLVEMSLSTMEKED